MQASVPFPARLRRHVRWRLSNGSQNIAALCWITAHPHAFARHLEWLWQRAATPMSLRVPWWPYEASAWVAEHLPPNAQVFEYGAGGSTLWLHDQGASVTAAEHHEGWHSQLAAALPPTVTLMLRPPQPHGTLTSAVEPGYFDAYVAAIDSQPDGGLDLVIVDGRARAACVRHAAPKVRPGGLLLLDDTERPRYAPACAILAGWERRDFRGLKPGLRSPAQTSVWRRSSGCATHSLGVPHLGW